MFFIYRKCPWVGIATAYRLGRQSGIGTPAEGKHIPFWTPVQEVALTTDDDHHLAVSLRKSRLISLLCLYLHRLLRTGLYLRSILSSVFNVNINIYRAVILPIVLCGCETWSLTLREEHRLRVFGNRVLRRIFRPKWSEVKGNGEKYIIISLVIYSSPSIFRVIKSR